jgi:hypothetical protein
MEVGGQQCSSGRLPRPKGAPQKLHRALISLSDWRRAANRLRRSCRSPFYFKRPPFVFTFLWRLTVRVLTWFNFSKMMWAGLQGFRTWLLLPISEVSEVCPPFENLAIRGDVLWSSSNVEDP